MSTKTIKESQILIDNIILKGESILYEFLKFK